MIATFPVFCENSNSNA